LTLSKEKKKTPQGIQSLEHAFFILDTIKKSSKSLTLSEISQLTNMSKSRVQKYIVTFLKLQVLVLNKKDYTYSFGSKLLDFGLHLLKNHNIIELSDPYLKKIREELNQASALNIWTQNGPVAVKSESSSGPISVDMQVGYRPPLFKSATGKCFVAFMDPSKIKEFTDTEVQQYNLGKELEDIRKNGYSFRNTIHEGVPGGVAIACPVFDYSEDIIAVLSIIGFSGSIETDPDSKAVQKLKKIASDLSRNL